MNDTKLLHMTFTEYAAATTTVRLKMENALELAEAFATVNQVTGVTGATLALMEAKMEMRQILTDTVIDSQDPTPIPVHKPIMDNIISSLARLHQREETVVTNAVARPEPTHDEVVAAGVLGQIAACVGNAATTAKLAEMMEDPGLSTDMRWDVFSFAQYMADRLPEEQNLAQALNTPVLHNLGLIQVLNEHTKTTETRKSLIQARLAQAAQTLCQHSGVQEVSPSLVHSSGMLRTLCHGAPQEAPHYLSISLHADHPSFIDAVLINHDGRRIILKIGDPFPQGFPMEQAKTIAQEFLDAVNSADRTPETADWPAFQKQGQQALQRACSGHHTLPLAS